MFSSRDALATALISAACYESTTENEFEGQTKTKFFNWGFNDVEIFEAKHGWDIDTQGVIATNDFRTVVAFRGTDSKEDWRTNLQISKEPGAFDGTYVHKGIQEAFFHVAFDVGALLARLHSPNKELWLTGHSLGGALCLMLASHMLRRRFTVDAIYTFGAPRIGDEAFCSAFNAAHTGINVRFVNEYDIVPMMPIEMLFSHTGNIVMLTESGSACIGQEPSMFDGIKHNAVDLIKHGFNDDTESNLDCHLLWAQSGYISKLLNL